MSSALPQFSVLYLISLIIILIGFITFNAVATRPADPSPSVTRDEGCYDNHTANHTYNTDQDVAVRVTAEEEEVEERKRRMGGSGDTVDVDVITVGLSTKM